MLLLYRTKVIYWKQNKRHCLFYIIISLKLGLMCEIVKIKNTDSLTEIKRQQSAHFQENFKKRL